MLALQNDVQTINVLEKMFLLSLLGAHINIIGIDIIACLSKEEEKHSFIKGLSL